MAVDAVDRYNKQKRPHAAPCSSVGVCCTPRQRVPHACELAAAALVGVATHAKYLLFLFESSAPRRSVEFWYGLRHNAPTKGVFHRLLQGLSIGCQACWKTGRFIHRRSLWVNLWKSLWETAADTEQPPTRLRCTPAYGDANRLHHAINSHKFHKTSS